MPDRTLRQPTPAVYSEGLGLRVLEFDLKELSATVAAGQTSAVMQTQTLPSSHILRIERIVVTGNSANLCEIGVYEGADTTLPIRGRDWTPFPSGMVAVAEYPSFLTIRETLPVSILITGANPGDQFAAAVQYQLCLKVRGQKYAGA